MKRLLWSALLVLPAGIAAADIYRSIDDDGNVVYSDRPTSDAVEVIVNTARPASRPAARAVADNARDAAGQADTALVAEIPREPTADEVAADRARNCEYARQMLATYSQSRRLFRTGPDGERQYLSDDELSAARARAESNVAAWCD